MNAKSSPLTIQKIAPAIAAAAAEALGGPAARPPALPALPMVPVGKAADLAAKREAFTAAQIAAAAGPVAPEPLGNPIFDEIPAALIERRQKISALRGRLAALTRQILSEGAELGAMLKELEPDADAIHKAELFDTAAATKFLDDLGKVVSKATAAPAAESKKA